jgi:uncharacterized UBP type Zn finger protein
VFFEKASAEPYRWNFPLKIYEYISICWCFHQQKRVVGQKDQQRDVLIYEYIYICSNTMTNCNHFDPTQLKHAKDFICSECVKIGDIWVHLRTCQTCGVTLCCDNSKNKHASKHYHSSQHPVVISAEPEEYWAFCYPDDLFMEYDE